MEKPKLTLRELIFEGIKKFAVGIIAAVLTSLVLWSFPQFRDWLNENNINGGNESRRQNREIPSQIEPQEAVTIEKPTPAPTPKRPAMSDWEFIKLCKSGDAAKVKEAIDNGANVNARESGTGWTALIRVTASGLTEIAELLLKHGADINVKDRYGTMALTAAATFGRTDIAELLLKYGADVNSRDSVGRTALIFAAMSGRTETAEILLKHGAVVNLKDNYGDTALMWASEKGHTKTAQLLLRYGAKY